MQYIIDLFTSLFDIFTSAWKAIGNIVQGLFVFLKNLPQALSLLTNSVMTLPPLVYTFAVVFISISVIYLVLGRDTGG